MVYTRHLFVFLLVSLFCLQEVVLAVSDEARCVAKVRSWTEAEILALSSQSPNGSEDNLKLHYLLFFLHVPRTGGRTFHLCFLKHFFREDERCPRSYDQLRIDRNRPACRIMSTHNDYSLVDDLAPNMTSIVTFVRKSVDRVLSSYEFSIEVAARSLRVPKKKDDAGKSTGTVQKESNSKNLMSTWHIWPWKHLVPFMQADLFARKGARVGGDETSSNLVVEKTVPGISVNDSYDAARLAMPFREFIHHPIARELVHNGATFQVAGLTNTSYLPDAGEIRNCVVRFPHLGKYVLDLAKRRLDNMLFVGLTERQRDSAKFFLKTLRKQVSLEETLENMRRTKTRAKGSPDYAENISKLTEEEVMEELLKGYDVCVKRLRKGQVDRRSMSLDMIPPIKFSNEIRMSIPDDVIQEVVELNSLDEELYAYAQTIFVQQEKSLEDADFHFDRVRESGNSIRTESFGNRGREVHLRDSAKGIFTILLIFLSSSIFVVGVVIWLVTKRQGARVKDT